jgi:Protein of unknown function (DUF3828)
MPTRRSLILGAIAAAIALPAELSPATILPAQAAEPSATAFVTAIYESYKGQDAKGVVLDNERVIRRYFEPTLATAMAKDQKAAARRNEVGLLDFDPFLESQDWEADVFDITVSDAATGKAQATVKFTNFGEAMTVVLDLVQVKTGWRIYDITRRHDDKG